MQAPNIIAQVLERMMPVGSIVEWAPVEGCDTDLSTPAKVAAYYGFGTWEPIQGRFLLAADGTYTAGSTGGEENHTHLYAVRAAGYYGMAVGDDADIIRVKDYPSNSWIRPAFQETTTAINNAAQGSSRSGTAGILSSEGKTSSESNMPPYLAVYMWRRTA